jgi:signal transduction histidine kinase/DNA-binding response OmpR family regulator
MTTEVLPKRRLRTLLTVPFISLIVAPSLVIAISSLYTGLAAVDTLSERIITDVSSRVEQAAVHQMEEAAITLRTTMPDPSDSLGGGAELFKDFALLEKKLFELTAATRTTSYMFYGAEDGTFLGVDRGRVGARSAATVRVRTSENETRRVYSARAPGDRSRPIEVEARVFDPRSRKWYQNAKFEDGLTWAPIYVSFASGALVTTASQPVVKDSKLLGVLAADVELAEISAFMKTVSVSENGVAFIIDSEGFLVASSAPGVPFREVDGAQERIRVTDSDVAVQRDAASWFKTLPVLPAADAEPAAANRASVIRTAKIYGTEGGAIDVAVRPVSRIRGVDWSIVVAIPRSDLTDPIVRSSAIMFLVIIAALAAALQLAMWIVRRVTSDVDQLVRSANGYAVESTAFAAPKTTLRETSELAAAFVGMFGRLRDSLMTIRTQNEDLAALNASLEERVERRTRQLESKNSELTDEMRRREQLENELRAASDAALRQADDKVRFMAMLSHELRTPLQAVIGASEMIAHGSAKRDVEAGILTAASKSILTLVDGVLSYARLEAGKVDPVYSTFDVRAVTREACDVALASDNARRPMLEIDVDATVPDRLRSDAGVYRQILVNLVANAMKHAPGARIVVAVSVAPLAEGLTADSDVVALRVSVSDEGAGIPIEQRHLLFQPFQQLGQGAADPSRGSGLGLAICALLVRALGGEVSLDTKREVGTSIQFWIRASRSTSELSTAASAAPDRVAPLDARDTPLRILLVDDHEVNLRLVTEMLRVLGHSVTQAKSGEAALALTREAIDAIAMNDSKDGAARLPAFDVVLMDLNLPGMSGFEAVAAIRSLCDVRGIEAPRFIALTASTEESDRVQAASLGMPTRVTKPATLSSLKVALRDARAFIGGLSQDAAADDANLLASDTLDQLVELEKKSGNRFVVSLIGDFLGGLDEELRLVTDALLRDDLAAAKRAAHALAGASSSIGARALAAALRGNSDSSNAEWAQRLNQLAARTRDALNRWVETHR